MVSTRSGRVAAAPLAATTQRKRCCVAEPSSPEAPKRRTKPRMDTPREASPETPLETPPKASLDTPLENALDTPLALVASAKAAFSVAALPGRLVGRDAERETIAAFLSTNKLRGGKSLYVSGVPGTGKTAMLDEMLADFVADNETDNTTYRLVKLNCMQCNDPASVYKKLMVEFGVPEGAFGTNKNEPYRALERAFGFMDGGDKVCVSQSAKKATKKKVSKDAEVVHILVLDEIDQLATTNQSVLYRIFEWAALPGSTLLLIGIANALDLLQRHLPRLSGMQGGPQLLNFNPYTPAEISKIIKSRLMALQQSVAARIGSSAVPALGDACCEPQQLTSFMHPMALEVCARKAAGTGDLRRALDLVRMSFEVLETEVRKKLAAAHTSPSITQQENCPPPSHASATAGAVTSPLTAPIQSLDDIPKVTVAHVLKAAGASTGKGPVQKVQNLATQQKAVLVALMTLLGAGNFKSSDKLKDPIVGNLHDAYVRVLKKKGAFKPVTKTEFDDILGLFETIGLVSIGKAKEERLRKVRLECLQKQVEDGIREDPVLWGIWMDLQKS
ncbi:AAA ATPase [Podochytrium sp. JEL0797]|nr:AAA ATPase [Podochytrium sp. JEL0797]